MIGPSTSPSKRSEPAPPATALPRRIIAWAALGVAVAVFAAFVPALEGAFLNYDDDRNFLHNTSYRGLAGPNIAWMFSTFHMGHYHPITWLTLGLDYVLWGMEPRGYHLTNNLLHALNAVLLFLIALRLLSAGLGGGGTRGGVVTAAAFSGLIFGLHPLRVESVAWLTERRDLVGALLLLATVLAYFRAVEPQRTSTARRLGLGLSLGLFIGSMMGKVSGMPLPLILLALDWYPLKRLTAARGASRAVDLFERWRPLVIEKLPFLLVAISFALVAAIGQAGQDWVYPLEMHGVTARVMQALYGLSFYLWKSLVPLDLLPLYELRFPMNPWEARFIIGAIATVILGAAVLALRKRWAGLVVAALAYAAFLAPVLGFVQNGPQIVADRYSYLAMMGFSIAAGGYLAQGHRRAGRAGRGVIIGAAACMLIVLASLTWRQCAVWDSSESLWSHVLARDPDCSLALNAEGGRLLDSQRPVEALAYIRRAVDNNPFSLAAQKNLRTIYAALGRMDEFRELLTIGAGSPDPQRAAEFEFHLGYLAFEQGRDGEAAGHFERCLSLTPRRAEAHLYWAIALERQSRADEAGSHYRAAARLKPRLPRGLAETARELVQQGRLDQAAGLAQTALKVDPRCDEARRVLADIAAAQPR
jgi:tetratricopeptide (TPR) repeat protein